MPFSAKHAGSNGRIFRFVRNNTAHGVPCSRVAFSPFRLHSVCKVQISQWNSIYKTAKKKEHSTEQCILNQQSTFCCTSVSVCGMYIAQPLYVPSIQSFDGWWCYRSPDHCSIPKASPFESVPFRCDSAKCKV